MQNNFTNPYDTTQQTEWAHATATAIAEFQLTVYYCSIDTVFSILKSFIQIQRSHIINHIKFCAHIRQIDA